MFLHEFLVVILGLLSIVFIEFSAEVALSRLQYLFLAVRGFNGPHIQENSECVS